MPFTLGLHANGATLGAATVQAVYPSNVTAGRLLIVTAQRDAQPLTISSISDTRGSTWHQAGIFSSSTMTKTSVVYWAVAAASGADTVTISFSSNSAGGGWTCGEFTGNNADLAQDGAATTGQGTADPVILPSIVSNFADALLVSYMTCGGTGAPNSPWLLIDVNNGNPSQYRSVAPGTYTPNVGQGGSNTYSSIMVALGQAGGVAITPQRAPLSL